MKLTFSDNYSPRTEAALVESYGLQHMDQVRNIFLNRILELENLNAEMLVALEEAVKELVADDIITEILREEHNLPHSQKESLILVSNIIKKAYDQNI